MYVIQLIEHSIDGMSYFIFFLFVKLVIVDRKMGTPGVDVIILRQFIEMFCYPAAFIRQTYMQDISKLPFYNKRQDKVDRVAR